MSVAPPMSMMAAAVALASMLSVTGCGPCLGVSNCGETAAHAAVNGRVLGAETGDAAGGAGVELIATYTGHRDSTRTVTDVAGLFSLELPPVVGEPLIRLSLRVTPRDQPGYMIDSVPCSPVTRVNDACVLGAIVANPFFPIFYYVYRGDEARPVDSAKVTFKRTGGSMLYGPGVTDPLTIVTDSHGIGLLFRDHIFATGLDPVIGDLTVELASPFMTAVRHGYMVFPTYRYGPRPVAAQAVGPSLSYAVAFVDSITGHGRAGVKVDWVRNGGIQALPDSFTTVSDTSGLTRLAIRPLTDGTIMGSLTIKAPGVTPPAVINGLSLTTFDADSSVVFQRWRVGATGILYPLPPTSP